MRQLGALGRQRLVVVGDRRVGVERQVELVAPAEVEAGARQGVIVGARAGQPLRQVSSVRRDLVGNDAGLDVVAIRQPQVLLRA